MQNDFDSQIYKIIDANRFANFCDNFMRVSWWRHYFTAQMASESSAVLTYALAIGILESYDS